MNDAVAPVMIPYFKFYEMEALCHAWAASPIYLIGRYFMGIRPLKPGYEEFEAEPNLKLFSEFKAEFPVGKGQLKIEWSEGSLKIRSSIGGGRLKMGGQVVELEAGKEYKININE